MDIVDDFLTRIRKHVGPDRMLEDELDALEEDMRGLWGGCQLYIRKDRAKLKAREVGEGLANGMSPSESFVKSGVSKSAGYRLLNRKV